MLQREDEHKSEWMIPRMEAAQSAGSSDTRPDNSKSDRASPKNETASNTFSNDSRPVPPRRPPRRQSQKRCSSGAPSNHKYWTQLQRLQRRIQRTLDQIRDPSRQLPARSSGYPWGIKAIALDMSALNHCNVESNTQGPPQTCRLPTSPHVSSANADKALNAEAASQASETKEEI